MKVEIFTKEKCNYFAINIFNDFLEFYLLNVNQLIILT